MDHGCSYFKVVWSIRTPTILLAGTLGMNLPVYTLFSSMGAFSWNFAWLWATWQGSKLLLTILGANASQNWLIAMLIGWGLAFASLTVLWEPGTGTRTTVTHLKKM